MKHYLRTIKNPSDSSAYKITAFPFPENAKLFIEYVGGSKEECQYKVENGICEITTPVFTINPDYINIGYEK